MFAVHHRPASNQTSQRGREEDVHESLACGLDPDGVHPLAQLVAVERAVRGK